MPSSRVLPLPPPPRFIPVSVCSGPLFLSSCSLSLNTSAESSSVRRSLPPSFLPCAYCAAAGTAPLLYGFSVFEPFRRCAPCQCCLIVGTAVLSLSASSSSTDALSVQVLSGRAKGRSGSVLGSTASAGGVLDSAGFFVHASRAGREDRRWEEEETEKG